MRTAVIILLTLCISILGSTELLHAQAAAEGKITEAETGQPLEGAHVYLSGTTIGTAANARGQYRLEAIPPGGHRLVVSMIGYGRRITDIVIGPDETKEMDFELEPVLYEIPELFVGDFNKKWKKNLSRFTDHFIGESAWSDSVQILNPKVLRFDKKWWGRMSAKALAPLEIENRALGYRITYFLDEFNQSGTRTRWDGEPLFTEMAPDDSTQAAYWKRNRREAFNGSLRHFLLALLADRVQEEGFMLYNIRRGVHGFSSQNRRRIKGKRLIKESEESYLHRFNFFGQLQIIYTKEEADEAFLRWMRNTQQRAGGSQTSYLKLNEHPITVDSDGEIIQPYGATQFGYFAFSRLADLTPRGYRPEGYAESNEK
jgi:hypothetical protein